MRFVILTVIVVLLVGCGDGRSSLRRAADDAAACKELGGRPTVEKIHDGLGVYSVDCKFD